MDKETDWSVVITGFQGNWRDFHDAVPRLLDRHGLDVFTLVMGRDTLPAEIVANITHDRASWLVAALKEVGAMTGVVPTRRVGDVRYRAEEVWATHATEDFVFSEIDDMIFTAPALNARRNLGELRRNSRMIAPWQYERVTNRLCSDASWTVLTSRERVREQTKLLERCQRILQMFYPHTRFVLSHILGDSVSFYQFNSEVPFVDIASRRRRQEEIWCTHCHRQQIYRQRSEPDSEFPKADWGDCLVCGKEVLIGSWEALRLIGPGTG